MQTDTWKAKTCLAQMLKGGVIMDVVNSEQAKVAQEASACAVMALERVPADIRAAGGVARMADPGVVEAQEDCPIVIRVPACPMYPLLLQEKHIKPKHFPADMLRRDPCYGRGCAVGMPMGYVMVKSNGEVNPCMLLQLNLGNIREQSIISIWENSPVLAQLRQRDLLKGKCGSCSYRSICCGCRGRAYEETGDMMATDPGCWLTPKVASFAEPVTNLRVWRGE